jgi:hypothetical protein
MLIALTFFGQSFVYARIQHIESWNRHRDLVMCLRPDHEFADRG